MSKKERIFDIASEITGVSAYAIENDPSALNGHIETLDLAEIILEVEEEFDLIIEDEESIHGIGDLVRFVDARIA